MSADTPTESYDVTVGSLGARLVVPAAATEADVAVVEHTLPPRTLAAPLHRHSNEDEVSYVLEGEMTVLADDELTTVPAGESVVKGRDVWHTFWNAGEEPLRFLEIIAPGGFAAYFPELADLGTPDPTDDEWVSAFLAVAERYGIEVEFESVPRLCEEHGLGL